MSANSKANKCSAPPASATRKIAIAAYCAQSLPRLKFCFWKFVHNALIHPLLAFPWEGPRWLLKAHDWTAQKCKGAG